MIYDEYAHMKCKCGGIIGMRDKEKFSCGRCGKIHYIGHTGNEYDELMINDKTGWVFPMVKKK